MENKRFSKKEINIVFHTKTETARNSLALFGHFGETFLIE